MIQVIDATGAVVHTFASPFQKPAFKAIQVSLRASSPGGAPDEVVITARKGRRHVTAVFPA
jgi:hypothetical protein